MHTRIVLSALAAALFSVPGFAEEKAKDKDKFDGAYVKKAGDFELIFEFKKDKTFNFKMTNGNDGLDADAKYTLEKDGTVKAELTSFKTMGNVNVTKEKGYKFSFKAKLDGKKLTVSDIMGDDIDDTGKQLMEGEYEKK